MLPGSFKHRTISLQTQIFFDFFPFCFFCVRERYKSMGVVPTHVPWAHVEVRRQPQMLVPTFRLVWDRISVAAAAYARMAGLQTSRSSPGSPFISQQKLRVNTGNCTTTPASCGFRGPKLRSLGLPPNGLPPNHLPSAFLSHLYHFIAFFCLIDLAGTSSAIFNESIESRRPCLVLDFKRNSFSFFVFCIMSVIELLYIAFIALKYVLFITSLFKVFIMKEYLICKIASLHLLR